MIAKSYFSGSNDLLKMVADIPKSSMRQVAPKTESDVRILVDKDGFEITVAYDITTTTPTYEEGHGSHCTDDGIKIEVTDAYVVFMGDPDPIKLTDRRKKRLAELIKDNL